MQTRVASPYMMDRSKIGTAVDHYAMRCGPGATRADFVTRAATKLEMPWLVDQVLRPTTGLGVFAEVNHNRWIAKCSTCQGAEVVDPADRTFFCFSCMNVENGGGPRPVIFPVWDIMAKVEQALLIRPDVMTRNWFPWETVDKLLSENIEHGVMEA